MTTLVHATQVHNQLMNPYLYEIQSAMNATKAPHPFLAGANFGEAIVGCLATTAGIVTLVMTGGMFSAWITLLFTAFTTAIAAASAYRLWTGN